MTTKTIENLPPDLVEPIGNLIRKIAYTQLSAVRLTGISITTEDGTYALLTSSLDKTTTMLDIIPYLNVELVDGMVNSKAVGLDSTSIENNAIEIKFTNLKEALSDYLKVDDMPNDLLVTDSQRTLKLLFARVDRDMDSRSLQAFMPNGFIPVPTEVLRDFRLDYSKKEQGILGYSISNEFEKQLSNKITEVLRKIIS